MKADITRQSLIVLMLSVFALMGTTSFAEEQSSLVVTTTGNLGFRTASKEFLIGMKKDDFIKQFGQPEGTYADELCYFSKGVEVAIDSRNNTIKQMTFFYTVVDYADVGGGKYQPAKVSTDKGVSAGASREEIIKAHAAPNSEETDITGTSTIEYPWGRFYFEGNKLTMVEVQVPVTEDGQSQKK